jgi:hypothetical protein
VAERVAEAALTVRSPGHAVILDSGSGGCSSSDSTFDESIRIIGKHLDPGARDPSLARAGLGGIPGVDLVEEERGAIDLQASHSAKVP